MHAGQFATIQAGSTTRKTVDALVTLTAKTEDSFVVESVQLLSSDEAAQAKHSLLKLLHLAMHIHGRDRKRTVEWTDFFHL